MKLRLITLVISLTCITFSFLSKLDIITIKGNEIKDSTIDRKNNIKNK